MVIWAPNFGDNHPLPTGGNRVAIGETVLPSFQLHFSPFYLHVQGFNFRIVDESAHLVVAVALAAAAGVAAHLFESGDERLANGEMGVFLVQLGASASVLRIRSVETKASQNSEKRVVIG